MNPLRRIAAYLIGALTLAGALAPLVSNEDVSIPEHHLLHAVLLAGAVTTALLASPDTAGDRNGAWLVAVVGSPLLVMFLMWPSSYAYLDAHPIAHVGDHLSIALLGFLCTWSGQRYARGIGWIGGVATVSMAVLAAGGFGVVR